MIEGLIFMCGQTVMQHGVILFAVLFKCTVSSCQIFNSDLLMQSVDSTSNPCMIVMDKTRVQSHSVIDFWLNAIKEALPVSAS